MADLKDKLLRALAEIENVRRRAERDRRDAARYAIAGFAREILRVADNLSRALANPPTIHPKLLQVRRQKQGLVRLVATIRGRHQAVPKRNWRIDHTAHCRQSTHNPSDIASTRGFFCGASVSADDRSQNEALDTVVSGVEMTEREMLSAFEREGIRPIEALGQKFDHNVHEAMFELDDPSKPPGTVVHVLERGYMLNDRLLRPAKVGTAKGGETPPLAAPAAEEAAPQAANEPGAEPASKGPAKAYQKQADARGKKKSSGSKVDEKH